MERWLLALDQRKIIGVVFIDFQKAFDCVNHGILTDKLSATRISGTFYEWLIDYLSNLFRCPTRQQAFLVTP